MSTKKKRLYKPNDPTSSSHSSLSGDEIEKQTSQTKKQKITENETTQSVTTDGNTTSEVNKVEEPVASTTNEKKVDEQKNDRNHHSRSTSASSSKHRKHSSHRRHRHHRRHSSSSSSRSSYSSTSSDSSRSSSSRSRRRRRRRRSRSSRSSSRSSSSSSDNRSRHSSRSSRRSSRSYSRRRSSSSRSSRSSTSSRSSHSRSRSRNHYRKSTRRSNNSHQQQSNNNGKGRGGGSRRGRGARNGPRGRRAPSNENQRRSSPTNRNGNKFNPTLSGGGGNGNGVRKLPNNKQPRVLIAATPKLPSTEENLNEIAATSTTTTVEMDEIKTEPIILTTNQNQQRLVGQKKNAKGKNKQQTPAYSLKKEEIDGMDQDSGEPIIGPKLPPEFEKKISKDHSFTPPDMDDPENLEMLNDLKYRAEIHAAKNHGLITEIQAQQLIEERETQKQLVDFPLIQMPIMSTPTISSMPSFIVATPNPMIANYHHFQVTSNVAPQIVPNPETSPITVDQQQQQQQQQQLQSHASVSPNSAASSGGESCSTPGQTTPNGTTTVLTQDGQQMMIQATTNANPQLVQIAQPQQQLYMPMQSAIQQPRIVAVRTPQGGLQHFIEYPTAQLLQAQQQQQQQQPQFIQHNGQLVQVIRPQVAYSTPTLMQQLQLQQQQQQQQQALAAQFQAQQLAAMQQTGGAIFLQNSSGQIVLAQQNPQAMRVVQIPYVPK
ncbi:hypothetical protein I4U23_029608 [Adineta vaga]|nr:hypothetical protein I4U23_029608 [Adineta vaga]